MAKTLEEITNSLFGEDETITREAFADRVTGAGLKLADLSEGDFVTVGKYNDHVAKYNKLQKEYETLRASGTPDKEALEALTAERDSYKQKFEESSAELTKAAHTKILQDMKVDPRFSGFVEHEVAQNVTDTVDFKTAAASYLKKNEQYVVKDGKPSGLVLDGGKPSTKSIFSDLNDFVRGE